MASPNTNYVKFQRGTIAAYDAQKTANKINNDTLYFVYENASSTTGKLYLGQKLISGGAGTDIPETLSALAEVLDDANANSFLVFQNNVWKVASASDVQSILGVSSGGDTLTIDEDEFVKVSNELQLLGFSSATEGQIPTKSNGKLTWTTPVDLSGRVETLETTISGLDTIIANAISSANHITYKPVTNLEAAQAEKTANTIYLVPNGETSGNNIYDEYLVVNNNLEKLNTTFSSPDLSGYVKSSDLSTTLANYVSVGTLSDYVTTTLFNSTVGNLSDFNSYVENETDSIVDMLNVLDQRLTWSELT